MRYKKKSEWKWLLKSLIEVLCPQKLSVLKAFDVPPRTLMAHLNGATFWNEFWNEAIATCWKLSNTGEAIFSKWILDMEKCGLPVPVSNVRHLAGSLLSADLKSSSSIVSYGLTHLFKCYSELKSKYTHQYGYQRAKCEDWVDKELVDCV